MSGVGLKASRQSWVTTNPRCSECLQYKGKQVNYALLREVPRGIVDVFKLDLQPFNSVKSFANSLKKLVNCLNINVMNAGLSSRTEELTPDEYHMLLHTRTADDGILKTLRLKILQVNFLSTTYLSLLLMHLLSEGVTTGRACAGLLGGPCLNILLSSAESRHFQEVGSKDSEYYLTKRFLSSSVANRLAISTIPTRDLHGPIQTSVHAACSVIPTGYWRAC